MIVSWYYFDSPNSDKPSYLNPFGWPNFVGLVSVLYMSHCLLRYEAVLLEFMYKKISMAYTIGNIYTSDGIKFLKVIPWLKVTELLFYFLTIVSSVTRFL